MPAYEYQCKCGATTIIVRSITAEENKPICAKCALEMTRVFDKPAVTFKGDGWAGKDSK